MSTSIYILVWEYMCALVSQLIAVGALSKLLEKGSGRVGERKDRDSICRAIRAENNST